MNLLIIGATGGTGRQLVEEALAQGNLVTAFVRTPAKLMLTHVNLRVVQGDVLDPASLQAAIVGQDAVLCALGLPASDRTQIRVNGTRNIIRAMEEAGVKRLVCQSSLGIGDSQAALPPLMKYIIVPLILRHAFADTELQEACIRQSQLAWVIVRPGNLTDGPRTGNYRHGFAPTAKKLKLNVSRADVAEFMLTQVIDDAYLHQTPGISY